MGLHLKYPQTSPNRMAEDNLHSFKKYSPACPLDVPCPVMDRDHTSDAERTELPGPEAALVSLPRHMSADGRGPCVERPGEGWSSPCEEGVKGWRKKSLTESQRI